MLSNKNTKKTKAEKELADLNIKLIDISNFERRC